ncbi:MAG: hypothetical protein LBN95_04910 [Prevotellaceae bacterium]|jgi:hypothetical protein|nr:hypothetical protein [Prevotellaceae bacterium]
MKKTVYFLLTVLCLCNFGSCKEYKPEFQTGVLSLDSLEELSSNLPIAFYRNLQFLNETTGYALANNFIAKTIDGGINWTIIDLPSMPQNAYVSKVQFIDNQTYYAIAGDNTFGCFYKTTDGGKNWSVIDFNTYECPHNLFFLNNNVGFVVGKGLFRKTTDGGNTWTDLKREDTFMYLGVNFKNQQEGIVTLFNGEYLKTDDGGNTWQKMKCNTDMHLYDIYFVENKIYVSAWGSLLDLENGNIISEIGISDYLFIDANKCIVSEIRWEEEGFFGNTEIYITNDGWKTYNQKTMGTGYKAAIAKISYNKIMIITTTLTSLNKIYILKYIIQ